MAEEKIARYGTMQQRLMGLLGKLVLDLLFFTTRIETIRSEKVSRILSSRMFIMAFWHSRISLVSYLYKRFGAAILVSRSKDGEIIARILQRQGHETIRGSTTEGGLRALAGMIKTMKEKKKPAGIVPDGPQGPRFKVKPGVIMLAQKTGYPIVPVTFSAKRAKFFSSWDRFILPYPFTTCRVLYGNPISVPENPTNEEREGFRILLEGELCRITEEVDCHFGHSIS